MKQILFIGLLLATALGNVWGQTPRMSPYYCPVPPVDSTLQRGQAAHDNLWPGFGTGSRRQSDMDAANAFRAADIIGLGLTGVGAVGLAATAMQRSLMGGNSVIGTHSATPYFIFGGVALAGIATITTSRILAVRKAREYDMILFPTVVPGGAGVGVLIPISGD